jgi:tetratricopeptide (TPR) repeat protein
VEAIDLIDQKYLYPLHADFLSRLALTFSHGDYARIDAIRDREGIAESLFRKALSYGPDHRAFLGLGMLRQRQRAVSESIDVLEQGLRYFPDSPDLNVCLGLNYMSQGEYEEALNRFRRFPESRDAVFHAAACYGAMGDFDKERQTMERYKTLADEKHGR